jgi:hypothetical protein
MAMAMAIYIGETSFSKLEKATDHAKAMLNSWTTETSSFNESSINFNPGVPVDNRNHGGYHRNNVTQSDYEKYLWLFGPKRV